MKRPNLNKLKAVIGLFPKVDDVRWNILGTGNGNWSRLLRIKMMKGEVRELLCPRCFLRVRWFSQNSGNKVRCKEGHIIDSYYQLLVGKKARDQEYERR